MPKTTPTPRTVVVRAITANRWEVSYYRVDTPTDGTISMTIGVIAREMDAEGVEISRTALDLVPVTNGTDLNAVVRDFGNRTIQYALAMSHLPDGATIGNLKTLLAMNPDAAGLAYYNATRDALEARVQVDGVIPPDAT
jgi:hypothetical protein